MILLMILHLSFSYEIKGDAPDHVRLLALRKGCGRGTVCDRSSRVQRHFWRDAKGLLLAVHPANIICHIDGIAASAAPLIAIAADKIMAPENAFIAIHNPYASRWTRPPRTAPWRMISIASVTVTLRPTPGVPNNRSPRSSHS